MTRDLRPVALDDLGLLAAMRALARDFRESGGLDVAFVVESELPGLSAEVEAALYRTMQEALSNAARHADAAHVRARLEVRDAEVVLTVDDDGRGLPDDAASRLRSRGGLAGIRERVAGLGGHFDVGSAPDGGARVRVRLGVGRARTGVTSEAGVE